MDAAVAARASADMPGARRDRRSRSRGGIPALAASTVWTSSARWRGRASRDIAEKILAVQKLRISGDYLQTSAIVLPGARVLSAVNDPNDYQGPGTGYRLSADRAAEIANIPQAIDPLTVGRVAASARMLDLHELGPAAAGSDSSEIVIALGPAFGTALDSTLLGLPHAQVLAALMDGIRAGGHAPRVIKVYRHFGLRVRRATRARS